MKIETSTQSIAFPLNDEEQLYNLAKNKDHRSQVLIFEILEKRLPSLLTCKPSPDSTPCFWSLDSDNKSHAADAEYIRKNLPGHEVIISSANLEMQ